MPRPIWLTQRLISNDAYKEYREALDIRWAEFLKTAGIVGIPVPLLANVQSLFDCTQPKGLLLTGGNDLAIVNDSELSRMRDEFEISLIKFFVSKKLPVLGICRGMQLLTHFFGGEIMAIAGHVNSHHTLQIQNSRFLKKAPKSANSFHGYGVQISGTELRAVAQAGDGSIEALEHKSEKIFAVMWHPERSEAYDNADIEMFQSVFA